jgi:hypothetical protein
MRHSARHDHHVARLDLMMATGELTEARASNAVVDERRLDAAPVDPVIAGVRKETDVARKQAGEQRMPLRCASRCDRQGDPMTRQLSRALLTIVCWARSSFHAFIQGHSYCRSCFVTAGATAGLVR